jgi:hypothetical protein
LAVFRSGDASACTAAETLARTAVSRSLKVFSQTGSMFEKVSVRKIINVVFSRKNFSPDWQKIIAMGRVKKLINIVVSCPHSSSDRLMSRF